MRISLLTIDRAPSATLYAYAHELSLRGHEVKCWHVALAGDRDVSVVAPLGLSYESIVGVALAIAEFEPDAVVCASSLPGVRTTAELCMQLQLVLPGARLCLVGAWAKNVAAGRSRAARARDSVEVLGGESVASLLAHLGARARERERGTSAAPAPRARNRDPYGEQLQPLLKAAQLAAQPATVEAAPGVGAPLFAAQHRLVRTPSLSPLGALALARPLLAAGQPVRLLSRQLATNARALASFAAGLGQDESAELSFEVDVQVLDRALCQTLAGCAGARICIELGHAFHAALPPSELAARLAPLLDGSVEVTGRLVHGLPNSRAADLAPMIDYALAVGIERLSIERAIAPPDSLLRRRLRARRAKIAPAPPWEIVGAAEGRVSVRYARDLSLARGYQMLASALSGTGLLRALAQSFGSVADLLLTFVESERMQGRAPGPQHDAHAAAERLFEHLRAVYRLDLGQARAPMRYERSPGLELRFTSDGRMIASDPATGRMAHFGREVLGVLDQFAQATSLQEALRDDPSPRAAGRSDVGRAKQRAVLEKLVALGMLVPERSPHGIRVEVESAFTSLEEFDYHYRMLADRTRVDAYQRAIARVVRPGQHVLEIGTGTGILAVLAAKQGARVTAIEQYGVIALAREVARASGVAHLIHFVQGRSDLVELEERADVLLTELVGNRILNEGLLETTLDARQRLLTPTARLIPCRISITAHLGLTDRFDHLGGEFDTLAAHYSVAVNRASLWFEQRRDRGQLVFEIGETDRDFQALSDASLVRTIDLARLREPAFTKSFALMPRERGFANAVRLSFRLTLDEESALDTTRSPHGLHWCVPVFVLGQPLAVAPDRPLNCLLSYSPHGDLVLELLDRATAENS